MVKVHPGVDVSDVSAAGWDLVVVVMHVLVVFLVPVLVIL